jgi:hypothetical protein
MPEALFLSGGPYGIRTRDRRIHDALLPGFDPLPTGVFVNEHHRGYMFTGFDGMMYFCLFIPCELE